MKFGFYLLLLLSGSSFFISCKGEESSNEQEHTVEQALSDPSPDALLPTALVAVDYLRLREEPRLDAAEIASLRAGQQVRLSGEITGFQQPVSMRGLAYEDPWVRVQTADGRTGWVYGGGLSFRHQPRSAVSQSLIDGRLKHFLGGELAQKVGQYALDWKKPDCNELSFAERLKKSLELRPQIEEELNKHYRYVGQLPDFNWLTATFPPFFVLYDQPSQRLRLYRDFQVLKRMASRCSGALDDELVQLYLALFPDSLEHQNPSYLLVDTEKHQVWFSMEEGQASALLQRLSKLYQAGGVYRERALYWKDRWLRDLLNPDYPFWQDAESLHSEINAILEQNLPILSNEDREQLKQALQKTDEPLLH